MDDAALLEEARRAARAAYAPYSGLAVGAVALARDGRVFAGVNVECASYPLGLCAERAALARAVADGIRPGDVEAVAVTAAPCGGCRQWLVELRVGRVIYPEGGGVAVRIPAELLPGAFEL